MQAISGAGTSSFFLQKSFLKAEAVDSSSKNRFFCKRSLMGFLQKSFVVKEY